METKKIIEIIGIVLIAIITFSIIRDILTIIIEILALVLIFWLINKKTNFKLSKKFLKS